MCKTLDEKKCILGLKGIVHLAAIIPSTIFFYMSITYLMYSSPIITNCPLSNNYWYVLASTVYHFILLCFIFSLNFNSKMIVTKYVTLYLILIGLALWGSYEINTNMCSNVSYDGIVKFGHDTFTAQLILVIIASVINACILCVKSIDKYSVYKYKKSRDREKSREINIEVD